MDSPSTPTPSSSTTVRRRRISGGGGSATSPEFEFWNLGRNPSPPTLHSADELFSDGVLLPLHLLPCHPDPDPEPEPGPSPESESTATSASIMSSAGNPLLTASKRWKEIFKRREKTTLTESNLDGKSEKSSEKKREKKNGNGNNNNSAELNINIWPFSRSRSAGNNSVRSRPAVSTGRKVSSAPCSRSNSSGESKNRRSWPSSPGRAGVHLGRTSPIWQVRRNWEGKSAGCGAEKGRILNVNVPMCMRYQQHLSCRNDEKGAVSGGEGGGSGVRSGGRSGGRNGNLFYLRGLFSKKSVLTV